MAELRSFGELFMTLILVMVLGMIGVIDFIKRIFVVGPREFFKVKKRNVRPSILDGSMYGEHVFIRLKNARIKLHCVVGGQKDKPLMLFLHGFPEFWYSWRHQIKEFSKDYRTVAIDMRGYGESDKPSGIENYELSKLVADVDELITLLGYSSCILVAHDWGGLIAWEVAANHPDKVDRLIICNIPHPLAFEEHIWKSFSQLRKSYYAFFFQLPAIPIYSLLLDDLKGLEETFTGKQWGAKPGTFTKEDIECFKYNMAEYGDICGPINYYRAAFRYKSNSPNIFKKISMPTLIVWGTSDGALNTEMADMSKKHVDHLEIKYIEGASHWVQQECPLEVNAYMREFLSN